MLKNFKLKVDIRKILNSIWQFVKTILPITIGSVIVAVAYNVLVVPYGLLSGGLTGIALIGNYLLNIPLPIGILILNIPVFILGLRELNLKFILYSLIGTLTMAAALPLTEPYIPVPELDLFLAAVFSGVVSGIGGGIILRAGASAGGADIIAMIVKKKWNISIGACFFYFNVVVILMSLVLFELKIAL
ncbi:MAG: YitT family protein, partial [Syntrophaceticus schinkii]|nr:YitT family protein [Syntrophaceticus schinkii]